MLTLPMAATGALLALLITRNAMDITAMIGIILLAGIVTKNAILLVDFANQQREKGINLKEAILTAGTVRLRPVLMTTLSLIFGMLPVAIGLGAGGEWRSPMAITVIGGLMTSTLLTLVVVPVAYHLLEGRRISRTKTGEGPREAE
jgi:HAE1 family hydrophobic/amphiphilic exporter-1